jgi:N-acetylglucosaminyldiphosphoundecaprenol N-acetyl-beta-D-mannosaminyltransferase
MKINSKNNPPTILGMRIDPTSYNQVCTKIMGWATNCESRLVCAANVHLVMTAHDDPDYRIMINAADLVTPDGMPLVWTLRLMGYKNQERVYGPTLTTKLLPLLAAQDLPIGFLGSSPEVLEKLQQRVRQKHPGINIVYAYSPPFRELTLKEDQAIVDAINHAGVRVLFVGLGCPKQEIWMHQHKDKVQAVMLGVGAAFDFIAGVKPQAPLWVQRMGMEWFYRLATEPKRLWRRYVYNNPRFVLLVARELVFNHRGRKRD